MAHPELKLRLEDAAPDERELFVENELLQNEVFDNIIFADVKRAQHAVGRVYLTNYRVIFRVSSESLFTKLILLLISPLLFQKKKNQIRGHGFRPPPAPLSASQHLQSLCLDFPLLRSLP